MANQMTISPAAAILMRLRRRRPLGAQPLDLLHEEAAGEIERLDDEMARLREIMRQAAAEIERLRAALEYVASRQPDQEACHPTAGYSPEKACGLRVTRAREALRKVGNPPATP